MTTKKIPRKSPGRMRKTAHYVGRKSKAALSGAKQTGDKAAVYVARKAGKTFRYLGRQAKDSISKAGQQGGQAAHYLGEQAHGALSDAQTNGGIIAHRVNRQMPGAVQDTISGVQKEGSRVGRSLDRAVHGIQKSAHSAFDPSHVRCSRCGRKFAIPNYCPQCDIENARQMRAAAARKAQGGPGTI